MNKHTVTTVFPAIEIFKYILNLYLTYKAKFAIGYICIIKSFLVFM